MHLIKKSASTYLLNFSIYQNPGKMIWVKSMVFYCQLKQIEQVMIHFRV